VRAGIRKVIIPEKNKKDLTEIPQNVKRRLTFIPVRRMENVLSDSLVDRITEDRSQKTEVRDRYPVTSDPLPKTICHQQP
jgi:ATP-dependent Lon protease